MDGDLFIQILDDELQESLTHYSKSPQDTIYQQAHDPKHTCKKAQEWLNTMDSLFYNGLHSIQTLIQLSISGNTSKGGWGSMKYHQMGCWSCGKEWRLNGIRYLLKCVRTCLRRVEAILKAKGGHAKY